MNILSFLAGLVLALLPAPAPVNFGATVPTTPALIDTYLSAGIAATDNSLTLANGLTRAGTALSGTICLTLDANTPTVEYVCGTASSTSITGLSRGIDPLNPNTTSSALAYSHRRFASAQITDYPTLQFLARNANGVDPYTSPLYYSSGNATFITSSTQLVSKGYVDTQILAGGAPGSTITGGLFMLAATASTTQGTNTGTSGTSTYSLVPSNGMFNTTSSAANLVPVTGPDGKLSQGFLDFTKAWTFASTTTFTGQLNSSSTANFATTTFSVIPTAPSSTALTSLQLVNKWDTDYLQDKRYSHAQISATPAVTSQYMAMGTSTDFGVIGANDSFDINVKASPGNSSNANSFNLRLNGVAVASTTFLPGAAGTGQGSLLCHMTMASSTTSIKGTCQGTFTNASTMINLDVVPVTVGVSTSSIWTLWLTTAAGGSAMTADIFDVTKRVPSSIF